METVFINSVGDIDFNIITLNSNISKQLPLLGEGLCKGNPNPGFYDRQPDLRILFSGDRAGERPLPAQQSST